MIQDIQPHHLYNAYHPDKKVQADDFVICVKGRSLLVGGNGETTHFPRRSELPEELTFQFLFSIDEQDYYLAWFEGVAEFDEYQYRTLRELRAELQPSHLMMYAAYTGYHIAIWYRENRFCGVCGHRNKHSETERAYVCPHCGHTIYPRLNPAVIVAVTNGDKLLLTKYAPQHVGHKVSFYALIAGFTEIGETFEECCAREVMEETGLRIKNLRYYKSQPWGSAMDILVGFFCDVDGDTTIHREEDELREARWVQRADIELQPDDLSLTNEMMELFMDGKEPVA